MAELTTAQFAAAKAHGAARMRSPRAASAHYDRSRNRVIVRLTTGVEIGFAPHDVEGLRGASADDLKAIEVSELGFGIHFRVWTCMCRRCWMACWDRGAGWRRNLARLEDARGAP